MEKELEITVLNPQNIRDVGNMTLLLDIAERIKKTVGKAGKRNLRMSAYCGVDSLYPQINGFSFPICVTVQERSEKDHGISVGTAKFTLWRRTGTDPKCMVIFGFTNKAENTFEGKDVEVMDWIVIKVSRQLQ